MDDFENFGRMLILEEVTNEWAGESAWVGAKVDEYQNLPTTLSASEWEQLNSLGDTTYNLEETFDKFPGREDTNQCGQARYLQENLSQGEIFRRMQQERALDDKTQTRSHITTPVFEIPPPSSSTGSSNIDLMLMQEKRAADDAATQKWVRDNPTQHRTDTPDQYSPFLRQFDESDPHRQGKF